MKITIVQGAFLPVPPVMGGAVEKVWFALGKQFAARGHSLTHISKQHPELPKEEEIDGVRHCRIAGLDTPRTMWKLKLWDLIYSLRVLRVLPRADILVTNTFWLPILVRSGSRGHLYVHVARYPKGQMRLYRHAPRLQTVSSSVAAAIVAEDCSSKSRVKVIGNPLPDFPSEIKLKKEQEILYAGRIHPEKGIHLLINAFRDLPEERRAEWCLKIVGPYEEKHGGAGRAYRKQLQEEEGLEPKITWHEPAFDSEKLAAHYRSAGLFVYPSLAERGETFGLAPLEAMSHGCPALVSDLACFRDYLEPEINGWIFDHRGKDPVESLVQVLGRLLSDSGRLAEAGGHARRKAAEFRVESIASLYLEDFATLLAHGKD